MEVMSWWRKQCHGKGSSVMVNVAVLWWRSSAMVKEAVLWWRKQCNGKESSFMVKEAVPW